MKIENLIPISEVSEEKLNKLFDENENFAWNCRHAAEQNEIFWAQDAINYFSSAKLEYEFGIYVHNNFTVNHDPASAHEFIFGMAKLQKDREVLDGEQASFINTALAYWSVYANNTDPEEEDNILSLIYTAVDILARMFESYLKKSFEFWEDDDHVKANMGEFVCNYGDDLFLDPTTDKILELAPVKQWDF